MPTLIGRLHSLGPDQRHGYAHREIGDHSPNWPGVPRHSMGILEETNNPNRVSIDRSGPGQSAYELLDRDVMEASLAWLDGIKARRASADDTPFALSVGFMLPHAPYVATPSDYARFDGRVPPPRLAPPADETEHPWLAWWRRVRDIEDVPDQDALRTRTAYYALTFRLDTLVGRILNRLAANDLDDNTLVVYASDHGDQIGERGLWWKHTFYDCSAKVPLIFSWPGRLPQGERRSQIVNLVDVTQTILEALGATALPNADGRSLLRVALDAKAPWIDSTVSEYCTDPVPDWTGGMTVQQRMLRERRWKLIYYHGYPPQLFDLETDPDELQDLAANEAHAPVRDRLLHRLLADWNPEAIAQTMARRREDRKLIGAWARAVHPGDVIRWPLLPEQNRLEAPV